MVRPMREVLLFGVTILIFLAVNWLLPWWGSPVFLAGYGAGIILWLVHWVHEK